jgi:cobalt-precorrin 5A hydrolase
MLSVARAAAVESELGIWLVRAEAENLGERLQQRLGGDLLRPWLVPDMAPSEQFQRVFSYYRQWLLVMASGIAVRYLDGLLHDKRTDPGVVVLDEAARYAVPLLGGHEGGANLLAYRVANAVGAIPIVTTASEARKPLVLGIGCRKGVTAEAIEAAVRYVLGDISLEAVREVATVSVKAGEPGLLAFCQDHRLPLRVISLAQIEARAWVSQPSSWVKETLGVDGVCEPAALIACPRGRLAVPKTVRDGVTVAVVLDTWEDWS